MLFSLLTLFKENVMRYLLSTGKLVFVKFKHNYNNHSNSPNYKKPIGTSCWIEINGIKVVEAESFCHKYDHFEEHNF